MPFDGATLDVRGLLMLARDEINTPRRWCKYQLYHDSGRRCLIGAILHSAGVPNEVAPVPAVARDAIGAVWHMIEREYPRFAGRYYASPEDLPSYVGLFNDRGTTKHKDIIHVLDCAIGRP